MENDEVTDLEFKLSWNQTQLDEWFRQLLPEAFTWLDAHYGRPASGKFHWVLLRKDHASLFVVHRATTTGVHVSAAKGSMGRKYTDYSVRIG